MAGVEQNSFTRFFPPVGHVQGFVTAGATPTVTLLTGNAIDQGAVSITRGGVGVYSIAITNFKGPSGVGTGKGTSVLSGVNIACSTGTYSGNTVTLGFGSMLHDGTYSDSNFTFEAWAY